MPEQYDSSLGAQTESPITARAIEGAIYKILACLADIGGQVRGLNQPARGRDPCRLLI